MSHCPLCALEPAAPFDSLCPGCRAKQQRGELRAVGLAVVLFLGAPLFAWLVVG